MIAKIVLNEFNTSYINVCQCMGHLVLLNTEEIQINLIYNWSRKVSPNGTFLFLFPTI